MSNKKMIIVHQENNETAARIVVGFLQSNGIEAMISEDDAGDQLPSLESVRRPSTKNRSRPSSGPGSA